MNIPYSAVPRDVTAEGMLVCVRCTDEQAARLARILRTHYPAARPRLLPLLDAQQYSHCFRVPDDEGGLRRRWPSIQVQMLLGDSAPAPRPTQHQMAVSPPSPRARGVPPSRPPRTAASGTDLPPPAPECAAPTRTTPSPDRAGPPPPAPAADLGARTPIGAASASAGGEPGAAAPAPPSPVEAPPSAPPEPPDPRLPALDQLLAAGELEALIRQVRPDDPVASARGRLGVALARQGAPDDAAPHLLMAWQAQEADQQVALELARILWHRGDYDLAAAAYRLLLDAPLSQLDSRDHAAIAELASSGEFPGLSEERQLHYVEAFFNGTDVQELHASYVVPLARRGLALARHLGTHARIFRAYQHLLDVLLAHRAGQRLHTLLDDMRDDYWQQLLSARDRFDLLDEISEYVQDYPLLREPLIDGCDELLRQEMVQARAHGAFADYAKDLYRTWRKLARRGELGDAYRQLVADLRTVEHEHAASDADAESGVRLDGKRIALVGGHARTREHVRARLESWGARVDEVAPPTNGRIKERDIADKVHSSDLILLIVGYMGHDMSTVVNNLVRRDAVVGKVLPLDCRGTSGICRAIAAWATQA